MAELSLIELSVLSLQNQTVTTHKTLWLARFQTRFFNMAQYCGTPRTFVELGSYAFEVSTRQGSLMHVSHGAM
jgi:hypothetical protein